MKITIAEVAERAGVSITTVSRVINDNYPVKKETRKKVEAAIEELGFTPNVLARSLIQKKTFTIGVVVPSITNLFFPAVVRGIQDNVAGRGYQIYLCDTGGDAENESRILESLLTRQVDGIISIDPRDTGLYYQISVPLVLINGNSQGVKLNFVQSDQEGGTREAISYLLKLGHRDIFFIHGQKSYSYDVKLRVYRQVLEENGIGYDEAKIIYVEDGNSIDTIDLSAEAVMEAFKDSKQKTPTAIFACNDWMAAGAIRGLQQIGLKVPDDVSVIGYDNTIISQITMPRLTTVDQNMRSLGDVAAERLFSLIEKGNDGCFKVTLDTNIVCRESCKERRSESK